MKKSIILFSLLSINLFAFQSYPTYQGQLSINSTITGTNSPIDLGPNYQFKCERYGSLWGIVNELRGPTGSQGYSAVGAFSPQGGESIWDSTTSAQDKIVFTKLVLGTRVYKYPIEMFDADSIIILLDKKYFYSLKSTGWTSICSTTTTLTITPNTIKSFGSYVYFMRINNLYRINSTSTTPELILSNIIGFNFDYNNKIWYTTTNSLNNCNLDGSNISTNVKTGSYLSTNKFVVNPTDTSFIFTISKNNLFFDKYDTLDYIGNIIDASTSDSVTNFFLDKNNNIYFNIYTTFSSNFNLYKIDINNESIVYYSNPSTFFTSNFKSSNQTIIAGNNNTITTYNINHKPAISRKPTYDSLNVNNTISYKCTLSVSDDNPNDIHSYSQISSFNWLSLQSTPSHNAPCFISTNSNTITPGIYEIKIQVSDNFNPNSYDTISWNISVINHPPLFTSSPITSINENSPYSYSLSASDQDNDPISFSIIQAPSNMSISSNSLIWNPTQSDIGNHSISLKAQDNNDSFSIQSFTLTVNNVNYTPVFTSSPITSINEKSSYSYTLSGTDEDNDPITFSITQAPSGMTISNNKLIWNPVQSNVGIHSISLKIQDNSNASSIQSFNLTVNNVNDIPFFTSTPITSINEKSSYSYTLSGTDEDNDPITFSITQAPSNMSISNNKLIWNPIQSDVGIHSISLKIEDNSSSSTQSFNLTVNNINDVPIFTSTPITSINEKSSYSYTLSGSDSDNDPISFSITQAPTGMTISNNKLIWNPVQSNIGIHSISIKIQDNNNASSTQSFNLTVVNVNDAPIFTSTPITSVNEKSTYTYQATASDLDNDALTFSLITKPYGMTITSSGLVQWTPNRIMDTTVIIEVRDNNLNSTQSFNVSVNNVNDAPIITTSNPITIASENIYYEQVLQASDPDNDPISWTIISIPSWLSFSNTTLKGTPTINEIGNTYQISILASDGTLKDTITYSISVNNVNDAPIITTTNQKTTSSENVYYEQIFQATDPDNDILTWTAISIPSWITFSNATIKGTPTSNEINKSYQISIMVSDGSLKDTITYSISVNNVNDAPVITTTSLKTVALENTYYEQTFQAADPDNDVLTWTAISLPSWLSTGSPIVKGTPTINEIGKTYQVSMQVSDGILKDTIVYSVTVNNVNDAPVFTSTPKDTIVNENDSITFSVTTFDPDQTIPSIQWIINNQIKSTSTSFKFKTDYSSAGVYPIIIKISDSQFQSQYSFKVTVRNINRSPIFSTNDTIIESDYLTSFSFPIKATDADSDSLIYSFKSKNDSISISGNNLSIKVMKTDTVLVFVTDKIDFDTLKVIVISIKTTRVNIGRVIPLKNDASILQDSRNSLIKLAMVNHSMVRINIYDLSGKTLYSYNQSLNQGYHTIQISQMNSKKYIVRIEFDTFRKTVLSTKI